jgi:hypothetical protein
MAFNVGDRVEWLERGWFGVVTKIGILGLIKTPSVRVTFDNTQIWSFVGTDQSKLVLA